MLKKKRHSVIIFLFIIANAASIISDAQINHIDGFSKRGFCIDLRNEVMTMQALRNFAKKIADAGLNTLMVEWEATYPYNNNTTISNKLAYSRQEIKEFVGYCKKIGVDVIPIQQCFGHVEYILRHDRYRNLSEDANNISQICPLKSKEDSVLFADLFADQISLHNSQYMHIGGDETRLLGHCDACKKKVAEEGISKLFVDYVKMMCNIVIKLGKTPVMWSDMLLKHPEAADELPKETILIDWNYGWKVNHFGNVKVLQEKGFTFWGAPSIRSHPDNWFITDWATHFDNQKDFIPYARNAHYKGMMMTSWSTSGVYSIVWGVGNTIADMVPIRNNYPMSGFNILINLYFKALRDRSQIKPRDYILKYANEQFGLSYSDGEKFEKFFTLPTRLIENGEKTNDESILLMQRENNAVREILYNLKPSKNIDEFEQYRLMTDLRKYYLDYKQIEAEYNSNFFTIEKASTLLAKLEKLKNRSVLLDKRFSQLNQGYLKQSEIERQNAVRNEPVDFLYERVANIYKGNK